MNPTYQANYEKVVPVDIRETMDWDDVGDAKRYLLIQAGDSYDAFHTFHDTLADLCRYAEDEYGEWLPTEVYDLETGTKLVFEVNVSMNVIPAEPPRGL